jgi:pimeloyl-ACP methyl ester carboxylesterase
MKKILTRSIGFWLNLLAVVAPQTAARKGFYLFCTPLAPPVKDYHRKFLDTAEQTSFEFEGNRIQTYGWGTGPKKILFLHGWQSHSFRWKNYIEAFSKDEFTLLALDAPAHGLSGGKYINLPLYSRVVEHFILQKQPIDTVVCHSFGGFAMLYAFYYNPSLAVKKLILTGTPGEAADFMGFYQKVLGLNARTMKLVYGYFFNAMKHPPGFFSSKIFAAAVTVPGLIIHDENDSEAPYKYALEQHDAWKKSTLITTHGLGHNLKSKEIINKVVAYASGDSF